jgi:uncharacterized protein YyaL (SSP411 family)/cytochrome c biogenesis protein CcdA
MSCCRNQITLLAALIIVSVTLASKAWGLTTDEVEKMPQPLPSAEEISMLPPDGGPDFNRLIHEKSPYLLQHAGNPVDWYPWGTEAFARALAEKKPIFLSIGYSTCHWCHVMAHESFEHADVAEILNEHFISIKVDREERPDIDEIYMHATQLITGRGGWPNSVWLTGDGKPWYAGTYFPREDMVGRAGFKTILRRLNDTWKNKPEDVEAQAETLASAIQKMSSGMAIETTAELKRDVVERAVNEFRSSFDSHHGGFSGAPKFPPHSSLDLLFYEYRRTKDELLLKMATKTLDSMAQGGMRDHIGGGFHRYSTDAEWFVPHFEKMLYDNAQLARSYVDGYTLTGNEDYRNVAAEIYDWVLREMTDERHGFYSALDADSEGEEGKFYIWSPEQVVDVLGEEEGDFFCSVYDIREDGNFLEEATQKKSESSIPHLNSALHEIAKDMRITPVELNARLGDDREKLLEKRNSRVCPHLDDKVLTDWNGLMIGSFAYGGRLLEEPRYTTAAENAADFIFTTMWKDGKLLHVYRDGAAKLNGYLDDYAFLADGLLELYEATEDERWLTWAKELADAMLKDFQDDRSGGFFFTSDDHEDLLARSKDPFDRAIPSGNAVAVSALVRLGRIAGEESYLNASVQSLGAFNGSIQRTPVGTASMVLAVAEYFDGTPKAESVIERKALGVQTEDGVMPDAFARAEPVTAEAFASHLEVAPGGTMHVAVHLGIDEKWHINSNEPIQDKLVPTTIDLENSPAFEVGNVQYAEGKMVNLAFSPEPLSVYEGTVLLDVPVTLSEAAAAGKHELILAVNVQACDDSTCLAPEKLRLSIEIDAKPGAPTVAGFRHEKIFKSLGLAGAVDVGKAERNVGSQDVGTSRDNGFWSMMTDFDTEAFVKRYGYGPAFFAIYLLGMGLTLTPCVYPIVPVTVGYFGNQSGGRWTRRLALACVFGLGVAVSYAAAGTIAAFSGSLFGAAMHNPVVLSMLAAICIAMGLNAFGVYEFRVPARVMQLTGRGSHSGVMGAAMMGLTMGIAAASCLAAFIVSLLVFVAERGNPALGVAVFLTLGLGFATPFAVLAAFSGLIHKLPKSGGWLVYSRKVMGTLMFGAAFYFLRTVVPDILFGPLVLVGLAAAGLYFGFLEKTPVTTKTFRAVRLFLGISFFMVAIWWSAPVSTATTDEHIEWQPYSEQAIEQARENGKPVVIDFYADWCVACVELDRVSFADPHVIEASRDIMMLRADLTQSNTPEASSLAFRYRIFGFPTLVFLDSDGRERADLRIMQFVPAGVVLDRLNRLKESPAEEQAFAF